MALTQANRFVAVQTPLGDDALVVRGVSCTEQISRLFQIELDLISDDGEINFEDLIGENATIRLDVVKDQTRYFNGIINRFVQTKNDGSFAHYRATVVPWLWLLTRTSDCRIFQKKSIPDIIEEVFKGHGLDSYRLALSGSYQPWDYCVQYRETDFNFVSRLMEQEGIYYFFEHENGKHTLVIADSPSAHETYSGYETIIYRPPSDTQPLDRECVTDWVVEKELKPGAYALNDFNFETPKASLLAKSVIQRPHAAADFEVYDYPGEYEAHGDGEALAKVRIEELQSTYETLHAQASARGVCPGCLFTLQDHPREDQNREYLITTMSCQMNVGGFETGATGDEDEQFACSFTCIDSQTPYRPARTTAKPLVQGPQTAIVVGPAGEEIHTDEHGRVVVQFPWDRYGKGNENSSCWVRVSQAWAGKGWGSISIPRIGQEVIVEFLEGDPDRPIITGRVYNKESTPPYPLPDSKTISTTKSNSSKSGQGFNEIRFEDKKGQEQIFVHGEKNQDIRIKNDCFEWIGNNRHLVVKKDQNEHVENNRNETVDKDHVEKIGNDHHLKIGGKQAVEVTGSRSLTVKGDVIEVFKAKHSEQTTGDYYLKGSNVVIEGTSNVTVKVGGSSIAIASDGITITAPKVELEGQASLDAKSPNTTVKGDGMVTIQGGLVKIN